MIAECPAVGQMTVTNQADAIELERSIRRHVFAWLGTLDPFDAPNLRHPRVRQAEQRVRDAEWAQDWAGVETGWTNYLEAIRSVTP